jgi:hypothetical protein
MSIESTLVPFTMALKEALATGFIAALDEFEKRGSELNQEDQPLWNSDQLKAHAAAVFVDRMVVKVKDYKFLAGSADTYTTVHLGHLIAELILSADVNLHANQKLQSTDGLVLNKDDIGVLKTAINTTVELEGPIDVGAVSVSTPGDPAVGSGPGNKLKGRLR